MSDTSSLSSATDSSGLLGEEVPTGSESNHAYAKYAALDATDAEGATGVLTRFQGIDLDSVEFVAPVHQVAQVLGVDQGFGKVSWCTPADGGMVQLLPRVLNQRDMREVMKKVAKFPENASESWAYLQLGPLGGCYTVAMLLKKNADISLKSFRQSLEVVLASSRRDPHTYMTNSMYEPSVPTSAIADERVCLRTAVLLLDGVRRELRSHDQTPLVDCAVIHIHGAGLKASTHQPWEDSHEDCWFKVPSWLWALTAACKEGCLSLDVAAQRCAVNGMDLDPSKHVHLRTAPSFLSSRGSYQFSTLYCRDLVNVQQRNPLVAFHSQQATASPPQGALGQVDWANHGGLNLRSVGKEAFTTYSREELRLQNLPCSIYNPAERNGGMPKMVSRGHIGLQNAVKEAFGKTDEAEAASCFFDGLRLFLDVAQGYIDYLLPHKVDIVGEGQGNRHDAEAMRTNTRAAPNSLVPQGLDPSCYRLIGGLRLEISFQFTSKTIRDRVFQRYQNSSHDQAHAETMGDYVPTQDELLGGDAIFRQLFMNGLQFLWEKIKSCCHVVDASSKVERTVDVARFFCDHVLRQVEDDCGLLHEHPSCNHLTILHAAYVVNPKPIADVMWSGRQRFPDQKLWFKALALGSIHRYSQLRASWGSEVFEFYRISNTGLSQQLAGNFRIAWDEMQFIDRPELRDDSTQTHLMRRCLYMDEGDYDSLRNNYLTFASNWLSNENNLLTQVLEIAKGLVNILFANHHHRLHQASGRNTTKFREWVDETKARVTDVLRGSQTRLSDDELRETVDYMYRVVQRKPSDSDLEEVISYLHTIHQAIWERLPKITIVNYLQSLAYVTTTCYPGALRRNLRSTSEGDDQGDGPGVEQFTRWVSLAALCIMTRGDIHVVPPAGALFTASYDYHLHLQFLVQPKTAKSDANSIANWTDLTAFDPNEIELFCQRSTNKQNVQPVHGAINWGLLQALVSIAPNVFGGDRGQEDPYDSIIFDSIPEAYSKTLYMDHLNNLAAQSKDHVEHKRWGSHRCQRGDGVPYPPIVSAMLTWMMLQFQERAFGSFGVLPLAGVSSTYGLLYGLSMDGLRNHWRKSLWRPIQKLYLHVLGFRRNAHQEMETVNDPRWASLHGDWRTGYKFRDPLHNKNCHFSVDMDAIMTLLMQMKEGEVDNHGSVADRHRALYIKCMKLRHGITDDRDQSGNPIDQTIWGIPSHLMHWMPRRQHEELSADPERSREHNFDRMNTASGGAVYPRVREALFQNLSSYLGIETANRKALNTTLHTYCLDPDAESLGSESEPESDQDVGGQSDSESESDSDQDFGGSGPATASGSREGSGPATASGSRRGSGPATASGSAIAPLVAPGSITIPSKEALDLLGDATLEQRFSVFGVKERWMLGDGNCQFRSLADQLFGNAEKYADVREAAVDELLNHPERYHAAVDDDAPDFDTYVDNMSRDRTWGDHFTLLAVARAYGISIRLITSYTEDNWFQEYQGDPPLRYPNVVLWLSYDEENGHYNSLCPTSSPSKNKKKKSSKRTLRKK